MIHKLPKSPFKDVTLTQYQDTNSLFTKALKRRPSKEYEMPSAGVQVPAVSPQIMKKAPPSLITKGLVMPKIDYTCDEELVVNKRQDDSGLLCRQTFNNDHSLFCNEELNMLPTQKTQVKFRPPPSNDPTRLGLGVNNYIQPSFVLPVHPAPNPQPSEAQFRVILEKTAKILQAYEADKRRSDSERWELEFQNQKLKQRLSHYQKISHK